MDSRLRFLIAVLISLLAHLIVLMWAMQWVKGRAPDDRGLLQVSLQQHVDGLGRKTLQAAVDPAPADNKKATAGHAQKPAEGAQPSGIRRWQQPLQPDDMANAMQLAQIAHQRELRLFAVQSGLANLAVQLGPVITGKIVCVQQANGGIDCQPPPTVRERPLLEQFLNLALEARQLGIAGNPVRLDFGAERGVSVTLLH